MVWDFLAVDNFYFTRKIVKKNFLEKLVKMLGFCNLIFGQKIDFSHSVYTVLLKHCNLVENSCLHFLDSPKQANFFRQNELFCLHCNLTEILYSTLI